MAVLLAILCHQGEAGNIWICTHIQTAQHTGMYVCMYVCMYVRAKICNMRTLILDITDLDIPCLEVYIVNVYYETAGTVTMVLINLKIYILL
jgi:hypothetical protein